MLPAIGTSEVATALVRAWCRWHVAPVIEETLTLDTPEGAAMLLPSLRVVEVTACTLDGQDILDGLEWSADGMLRHRFRRKFRALTITIKHGFEAEEAAPLVDRIASRLTTQQAGAIEFQRAAGPFQQRLRYSGGGGLLTEDRQALEPYRLHWAP